MPLSLSPFVVRFVLPCLITCAWVGCSDENPPFFTHDAGMDSGGSGSSGTGGSSGTSGSGGSSGTSGSGGGGAGGDAAMSDLDADVMEDAQVAFDAAQTDANHSDASSCQPPLAALHASMGGAHVVNNDGVEYNSNPPSSGPHCGSWGRYAIYGAVKPLPRCNYIHNLEHGGVVLLYKCVGECPAVVAALSAVRDRILDEQCLSTKRVIITPDAALDTPIAATAWQNTWTSDCVTDAAMTSLEAFIRDNLGAAGLAPESGICSDGSVTP